MCLFISSTRPNHLISRCQQHTCKYATSTVHCCIALSAQNYLPGTVGIHERRQHTHLREDYVYVRERRVHAIVFVLCVAHLTDRPVPFDQRVALSPTYDRRRFTFEHRTELSSSSILLHTFARTSWRHIGQGESSVHAYKLKRTRHILTHSHTGALAHPTLCRNDDDYDDGTYAHAYPHTYDLVCRIYKCLTAGQLASQSLEEARTANWSKSRCCPIRRIGTLCALQFCMFFFSSVTRLMRNTKECVCE